MNKYLTHRLLLALLSIVVPTAACRGGGTCCGSSAGNSPPANVNPAPVKATYTCPMHADVVANAPGACPKCGMALVAKK
jgi:hypothetical protein